MATDGKLNNEGFYSSTAKPDHKSRGSIKSRKQEEKSLIKTLTIFKQLILAQHNFSLGGR